MTYRPDIDGLRAIAVLSVLFYHAHLSFPGGYVGVDIFFAISGYLITSRTIPRLRDGGFSVMDFWAQRIRRLLPALSFVTLATIVPALFFHLPQHLVDLGGALITLPLMLVNCYYWRVVKAGYFGDPPEIRPLLHTWSLGVEEQFYILFPLFLVLAWRRGGERTVFKAAGFITVISLLLSVPLTYYKPVATFFTLPTRAWEFTLGGLVALLPSPQGPRLLRELSVLGGLGLLIYCMFYFDHFTPFPGAWALVPVIGSLLIMKGCEGGATSVGTILSSKLPVHIGLISYSLYLWHWPILAYADYLFFFQNPGGRLLLVTASIIAGHLSWLYLETPLRSGRLLRSNARALSFMLVNAVTLIAIGLVFTSQEGFPGRWDPETLKQSNFKNDTRTARSEPIGALDVNEYSFMLWGDSHAAHFVRALDDAAKLQGIKGYVMTNASTAPLRRWNRVEGTVPDKEWQATWFEQGIAEAKSRGIKLIILSAFWNNYGYSDLGTNLRSAVKELNEHGMTVYVVTDIPHFERHVHRALLLAKLKGEDHLAGDDVLMTPMETTIDIRKIDFQGLNAELIDTRSILEHGPGSAVVKARGEILYRDADHLTVEGAQHCLPAFQGLFDALLREKKSK